MGTFLSICLRGDVIRRSARIAVVVGTLLVLINHGDALLSGSLSITRIVRILLTFCVPYGVATYAGVQAIRSGLGDRPRGC
ncbi:MAG: nitrate/nitrite transporter NrtS [Planctomycetes bacterium]|nr:nitrate/nitrite transporter NrtS [Planctomycetota bacterium]